MQQTVLQQRRKGPQHPAIGHVTIRLKPRRRSPRERPDRRTHPLHHPRARHAHRGLTVLHTSFTLRACLLLRLHVRFHQLPLSDRLIQRVVLHAQRLGHLRAGLAPTQQLLRLLGDLRGEHRRSPRTPGLIERRRPALVVLLHMPFHADRTDPKGSHQLGLLAVARHHQLTREHAKRWQVVLRMGEHRQAIMEIPYLSIFLVERQTAVDGGRMFWEQRKQCLGHFTASWSV